MSAALSVFRLRLGEVAVHLLSRLLAFDPEQRCTAEEALQHEFFSGLESSDDVSACKL